MKKALLFIVLLLISLHIRSGIIVFDNAITIGDTRYEIANGIKIYNDYIVLGGKTKILLSDLDANKFYILNGNTLVFGNTRYKLSPNDKVIVTEEKKEPIVVTEPIIEPKDEIKVLPYVTLNVTKCTLTKHSKEFPIKGKVKIVEDYEDIRVKLVDNYEHLRIIIDDQGSDCCHVKLWDDFFEDIRVKIVSSGEDITVRLVNSDEGIAK